MARKTSKSVKKIQKTNYAFIVLGIVLVIIAVYAIIYVLRPIAQTKPAEINDVIAAVNNETITLTELNKLYKTSIPSELALVITKETFLNESLIPQKILLQEARKKGISATEEEVDGIINSFILEQGVTLEQFNNQLKEEGVELEDARKSFKENLIITKLINQSIFSGISVTDKEVERFYKNNEQLANISYDTVKESIRSQMLYDKQSSAFKVYLNQLRKNSDIEIYLGNKIISFTKTNDAICREGALPIIRLFTSTNCEQCAFSKMSFDQMAKQYMIRGDVKAYHWVLDKGDNTITAAQETGIPQSELEIFKKYSPQSQVPLYVFGCEYTRIGNYYQDDANLEQAEFGVVIAELLK